MKQKDVAILFVATLAILLSVYYQGSYHNLKLVWVHPIDATLYENGHYPLEHERLPPPLITDVDGDGHNEVIVVTSDSRIKILEGTPSHTNFGSAQWHHLPIKEEASLLPSVGVGAGRRPVALASGYLAKYQEGLVRKQVIVVLTSGWTVLLFDNRLKLLWESTVRESLPAHLYHSEATLLVAPVPVRVGDSGVVVAAARLSRKPTAATSVQHDHKSGGRKASWMDDETLDPYMEGEEHFSYFAFDGRTGALRWKHEAEDFYDDPEVDGQSYGDRIGEERAMHLGEMAWNDFRLSVMEQLPHAWFRREDTGMRVAHFVRGARPTQPQQQQKQDQAANSEADAASAHGVAGRHVDVPGLMWGGHAPHAEDDFVHEPNVIVAHFADGVEVIHLYTGRPVTRMGLERAAVWDDLNGDGVVEAVRLASLPTAGQQAGEDQCWAIGQSGVPPQEDMFNVSICEPRQMGFLDLLTNTRKKSRDIGRLRATNPIPIARPKTWSEPYAHKDIVFLVSNGRMTSFKPRGHLNWMLDTAAEWASMDSMPGSAVGPWRGKLWAPRPAHVPAGLPITPSLLRFAPYATHGHQEELILGVGGSALVIVSGEGTLVGEAPLEEPPIARPAVGDFNNDGTNDVIVVSANAYYGYSMSTQSASLFLPSLLFLLLVAIGALAIHQRRHDNNTNASAGAAPAGPRLRRDKRDL